MNSAVAGTRTVADMVTQRGVQLSRYRSSKLMKALGLVSSQSPAHKYQYAQQEHVSIPNRLTRQFAVTRPDQV